LSHTPGPWEILTTNRKTYVVTNALSQPFVGQVIAGPTTCPDWESNARLIASAPDLLSALERLAHPMADDDDLDYARAIIAKAKGQQ
jgi:hypothetical protein